MPLVKVNASQNQSKGHAFGKRTYGEKMVLEVQGDKRKWEQIVIRMHYIPMMSESKFSKKNFKNRRLLSCA